MRTEYLTATLARNLVTASAVSLLLATPAFAQNQAQQNSANSNLNQQSQQSGSDQTNQQRAQNIEGSFESIEPAARTSGLSSNNANGSNRGDQNQEQEIIERSFDDEVDLNRVSNVKAGTTAGDGIRASQNSAQASAGDDDSQQGLSRRGDQQGPDSALGDVPDGTAVIAVDGEIIARTSGNEGDAGSSEGVAATEGNTSAESQASSEKNASAEQPSVAGAGSAEQGPQNSTQQGATDEAADLTSIFAALQDASVVNSDGQEIGSVEDVVLDNETGDAGLVVGLGDDDSDRLLAPVDELSVRNAQVIWDTSEGREELRTSAAYNPSNRNQTSAGAQLSQDEPSAGLSQR